MAKEEKQAGPAEGEDAPLQWHSPKEPPFQVAGLAWFAEEELYRRLPMKPGHPIRPAVDALANHTSGAQLRFRTNSARLSVRVRLLSPSGMNHMPATGQCGFDCYLGTAEGLKYCSTTKFPRDDIAYECALLNFSASEMRDVVLNFPLYQGVEEVLIGLDSDAGIESPAPYANDRRVIVYGTSITQGGCACRPGTSYTNILSRCLNVEFINLGFSGNGRGDPELAHLIAEIERAGCYVLDYEANATETYYDTLEPFIGILRDAAPDTPILVVSRILPAGDQFDEEGRARRKAMREFAQGVVGKLQNAGDENLRFVDGAGLLGENWEECTVDGSHPSDLGFMRMADALEGVVYRMLNAE